MAKKALVFGITGQAGKYLSELLLEKGYIVHGTKRRASTFNTQRVDHLYGGDYSIEEYANNFFLHYCDITDTANVIRLISEIQPDEIYNLAAQSHVAISFESPLYTLMVDANGLLNIYEAIRILKLEDKVKILQMSTSELFGKVQETPQKETTPFYPRSPYGCAKLYGFWITKNMRESYNYFAVNAINFNFESPYRSGQFVTKKITLSVAKYWAYKIGQELKYQPLELGNLNAKRDWTHAKDTMRGIHMILQHHEPDDFVLATGKQWSVKEFVDLAFGNIDVKIDWNIKDDGSFEGYDNKTKQLIVKSNPKYLRPSEVETLLGDYSKAKAILGWEPVISFNDLVTEMVTYDVENVKNNLHHQKFVG